MPNKMIEKSATVLASVGAINWGLVKFVNFDVLSLVPAGIITTVVVAGIAASGGWILYKVVMNK